MSASSKAVIRQRVWDRLSDEKLARFPYPPHGRIPNFDGAAEATRRLFEWPPLAEARLVKVNPDAPQRPLRLEALRRGMTVLVPTPRLRAGFLRLDPARIPEARWRDAAGLSRMKHYAEPVGLAELPTPDVLVVGSVAVSLDGARCGKGEGYADLEYGILRSLGHPPVPVATTVHDVQVVPSVPRDPTDLPIAVVATPTRLVPVDAAVTPPVGIDWARLDEARLDAMPVLRELKARLER